uniref:peptide-methionine (S)-S-oxide reductase n=1 Tax=Entomoneis paludosa TaxID=265537 RepID=A0A7S2YJ16_9STRA|mmetsp:Transcript_35133/g.73175  ORF Transcript_35133/g.73175 Transcript_35133/m.73175 type:complete len:120 (+) Transcript_35133:100-459(+)
MNGVTRCLVGYSGGVELNPTYQTIMDHTEALLIEYDPTIISYGEILKEWKHQMGEPYPSKRQYRSAIFCLNDEQSALAQEFCQQNVKQPKFVDIEPTTRFYMAEEYHQDYVEKAMRRRF